MTENFESAPTVGHEGSFTPAFIPGLPLESDMALTMRYGRKSKSLDELTFEFTREPALLQQYYDMYERESRIVFPAMDNKDNEDEYNRKSHIIVVRQGNMCVGGARLTIKTPRQPNLLPMETDTFRVENHFAYLGTQELRYGEVSRLVVLPEFDDKTTIQKMLSYIHRKAVALDLHTVFAALPLSDALMYKKHANAIGLKDTEIHLNIEVPPSYPMREDVKDYLMQLIIDRPHHAGLNMSALSHKHLPTTDEPIKYEMSFTRDKALIKEYKKLRERLYNIDPRFVGFRIFNDDAAENYEDENDQMLILHDDKECYGGACVRISTPRNPVILDLEEDILPDPSKFYFSLREHLPEMRLDLFSYAEFNRIVIDPRLRKGDATRRIFRSVLERCLDYRVRYMFGIGDKVRTRLYKQIYTNAGMECAIHPDIDIPMRAEYEGMKMHLLYSDMKKFYISPGDKDAQCLLLPLSNFEFS